MPPKKIIRKNYQNQQQQLQQQSQADITKYFKPVVVFDQRQQTPGQSGPQQSEADEEASQEDRQKAALQLIKLHNQLEGRPHPPPVGQGENMASSEITTRTHHHHYHHQNETEEVEELKIVEESEPLIDVGMEVEDVEEVVEVERPKKSSRKKLDFSKTPDKNDKETPAGTGKKRQSLDLDYSADADDEGGSIEEFR